MKKIELRSLLLALSITFILTAGLIYYLKLKSFENQPLTKVVVATVDISANSIITDSQVEEIVIPYKYVVIGFISEKSNVAGKVAKEKIYKGEQILQPQLVQSIAVDGLSSAIPSGYRAVTISVDMVAGVGGNLRIGDFVDVFVYTKPPYSNEEEVNKVFENVKIIDIFPEGKSSNEIKFITFLMNSNDAQKLLLVNQVGKVMVSLRNIIDKDIQGNKKININSLN